MEKFKIYLKIGTASREVFPIYGDDIKLEKKRESDQIFLRESVSGTFSFVRDDFDFIESCGMNTAITMEIYRGYSFIGSREFTKADCTFNYDDKICDVQITTLDRYEKILNLMDSEYNLVQLAPATQNIGMLRRALLQIYMVGDTKLTNYVGNIAYEQSCSTPDNPNDYGFRTLKLERIIDVPFISGLDTDIQGRYMGALPFIGSPETIIWRTDRQVYLLVDYVAGDAAWSMVFYKADGTAVVPSGAIGIYARLAHENNTSSTIYKTYAGGRTAVGVTSESPKNLYARILTGVVTETPRDIENDMVSGNTNYKYIQSPPAILTNLLIQSLDVQTEPTKWGTNSEGKYFVAPTLTDQEKSAGDNIYAIAWNQWLPSSFWLHSNTALANALTPYDTTWNLKDAYPLYSAISRLLEKVDNTITFGNGDNYSIFLNQTAFARQDLVANYPNFMRSRGDALFITPITNAKKTFYEQAAQKGNITLKNILDMLRNVFRCYWWIDDNRRLRIEHIDYFRKGKTYGTQITNIVADLTTLECPSVGKKWGYALNSASYDNSKLDSRYEFGWADGCTEQFNGYPIDLSDKFVKEGKEGITVDGFFADIDYSIASQASVSDDLYALIEAHRDISGNYSTQVISARMGSQKPIYMMQNGCLSFMYAEKNYYLYDLSGSKAKADGEDLDVIGIKRFKKQSVSFPITLQQFRSDGLIKTDLGIGEIENISYSLESGIATAEILQDIEVDYSEAISISVSGGARLTRIVKATNSKGFALKITYAYTKGNTIIELREATIQANSTQSLFSESIGQNHGALVVSAHKL